jgi:hypothetical protein
MGGRKSGDYPRTLGAFYRRFHDDDACLHYLVETRWLAIEVAERQEKTR